MAGWQSRSYVNVGAAFALSLQLTKEDAETLFSSGGVVETSLGNAWSGTSSKHNVRVRSEKHADSSCTLTIEWEDPHLLNGFKPE